MLGWFLFLRSFMSLVAMLLFFFLMIRRPPRSTLFPTRRSSDLVSIHDGIDTFSGERVEANVFSNTSGGVCLVVGIPDAFMVARVNPRSGREHSQFEVCDNDRGRSQGGRTPTGFHVDAMRWRAEPFGSGE